MKTIAFSFAAVAAATYATAAQATLEHQLRPTQQQVQKQIRFVRTVEAARLHVVTVFRLRHEIRGQRVLTWRLQNQLHRARTKSADTEKVTDSIRYLGWVKALWLHRHLNAVTQVKKMIAEQLRIQREARAIPPGVCESCWDAVAACESGGSWGINTGNGFHGGLQFTHDTWIAAGGGRYASDAEFATREQQITIASQLALSNWPVCGSRY